jgi:hypothetical protein
MKPFFNLKILIIVGILQTALGLHELMYVMNCEMGHNDCSYFMDSIFINFPASLLATITLMLLLDHLHAVDSPGAEYALSAFMLIVVGTIWWTLVLTQFKNIGQKYIFRSQK